MQVEGSKCSSLSDPRPLTILSAPNNNSNHTSMARIGIVFGLLLCVLAFVGLCGSPHRLPVQFAPMILGIPIFLCGVFGLNPHRRRASMNSALMIGLTGLVSSASRAIYSGVLISRGEDVNRYAFRLLIGMVVLCLMFIVAWGISYRVLRRKKNGSKPSDG